MDGHEVSTKNDLSISSGIIVSTPGMLSQRLVSIRASSKLDISNSTATWYET